MEVFCFHVVWVSQSVLLDGKKGLEFTWNIQVQMMCSLAADMYMYERGHLENIDIRRSLIPECTSHGSQAV
jgi:hypothetical protein